MNYKTIVGLEIHVELQTKTKAFCSCENAYGKEPNTLTCPVCLGLPGGLPVLNENVVRDSKSLKTTWQSAMMATSKSKETMENLRKSES